MKAKEISETSQQQENIEEEKHRLQDIDTLSNSEILGGEQVLDNSTIDHDGVVLSVGDQMMSL